MVFVQVPLGESLTHVTVGVLQLSLALPPAKSCGGMLASLVTLLSDGQVITGGVMSRTVTVFEQVLFTGQPLLAVTRVNVKVVLQLELAITVTLEPEVDPLIVPPPEIVHA
jgi:hypothetical protein